MAPVITAPGEVRSYAEVEREFLISDFLFSLLNEIVIPNSRLAAFHSDDHLKEFLIGQIARGPHQVYESIVSIFEGEEQVKYLDFAIASDLRREYGITVGDGKILQLLREREENSLARIAEGYFVAKAQINGAKDPFPMSPPTSTGRWVPEQRWILE